MPWLTDARLWLTDATVNIGVGAIVLVVYCLTLSYFRKANKIELATIIALFFSGYSSFSGIAVLLIAFDKKAQLIRGLEPTTYFIAGLAVIYVAVREVVGQFKKIPTL